MWSRLAILLFAIVCGLVLLNTRQDRQNKIYKYDVSGYHLHLPAVFVYDDLSKLAFYSYLDEVYRPGNDDKNYCIYSLPNGNRINRYSIGVAVMETPFFLAAHGLNSLLNMGAKDGYSLPYQWGTVISNLFWIILGLFILRRVLLAWFPDATVALTLLAIALGTNLYYYTVFSPGTAHGNAFFLFAVVLLSTQRWYDTHRGRYLYILAVAAGLIAITRLSDLVVLLIPLLWNIRSFSDFKRGLSALRKYLLSFGMAALLFVAVFSIQPFYWKYITGNWFYDGYAAEGFVWTEPMIWKGLFGFRKGWFIYTPVALLASGGLFLLRGQLKHLALPIAAFMVVNIYIIFSWWNWWYGGGFGCRPLIESFAVLSIPLAAFIHFVSGRSRLFAGSLFTILAFFIFLNMFQGYQAYRNVLHWDQNTWKYYRAVFLKTSIPPGAEAYLQRGGSVNREMEERLKKANK